MKLNHIYNGDCLEILKTLPDRLINCCVTSPPYWELRDYGHDGQIGLEKTPEEYVGKMVTLFREVKRVLKDDGTLWINLGDSYAGASGGDTHTGFNMRYSGTGGSGSKQDSMLKGVVNRSKDRKTSKWSYSKCKSSGDIKTKDLVGIPWMVAFALRTDGWYLRQDIIWHKPNPMPESVTDRCTKSHEYIFLMSKNGSYYYNADAIKEKAIHAQDPRAGFGRLHYRGKRQGQEGTGQENVVTIVEDRNKRSVWTVTTKPFSGAHFATFPEDLILPCILAGCPQGGVVLDPFMGAGTTALVAKKNGCQYVGCELNPEYINIAEKRLAQDYLFSMKDNPKR